MSAAYGANHRELRNAARVLATLADQLEVEDDTDKAVRSCSTDKLAALDQAERLYRLRREREKAFSADLFGEPAWDLLLDLFIQGERRKQVSVSSACLAAAVPPTTALRWIDHLAKEGHLERIPDAADGRRIFLQLTASTRSAMFSFFDNAS